MSSCLLKIATLPVKTLVALMKISAGLAQMASNAARHRAVPLEVPVMNHALVIEAPDGREVACSAPGSVKPPVDVQYAQLLSNLRLALCRGFRTVEIAVGARRAASKTSSGRASVGVPISHIR